MAAIEEARRQKHAGAQVTVVERLDLCGSAVEAEYYLRGDMLVDADGVPVRVEGMTEPQLVENIDGELVDPDAQNLCTECGRVVPEGEWLCEDHGWRDDDEEEPSDSPPCPLGDRRQRVRHHRNREPVPEARRSAGASEGVGRGGDEYGVLRRGLAGDVPLRGPNVRREQ